MSDQALVAPAPAPKRGPSGSRRLRLLNPSDVSPKARKRRSRLAAFGLVAFVATGLFGVVAFHVILTQNQFRLEALRTQAATEETRYERLRLQVDQLQSPQHIVDTAQKQLHMVLPPTVTYLTPTGPVGSGPVDSRPVGSGPATLTPSTPTTFNPPARSPSRSPSGWAAVKPNLAPRP